MTCGIKGRNSRDTKTLKKDVMEDKTVMTGKGEFRQIQVIKYPAGTKVCTRHGKKYRKKRR